MSFNLNEEIYDKDEQRILEEAMKTKEYAEGLAQGVRDYEYGYRFESDVASMQAKKYNDADQRINYELGWQEGWRQAEGDDCTTKQFSPMSEE